MPCLLETARKLYLPSHKLENVFKTYFPNVETNVHRSSVDSMMAGMLSILFKDKNIFNTEIDYKQPKMEYCGYCKGSGNNGEDVCPMCDGSGVIYTS
jgi:DnaJ-class molecular chaperone